MSSVNLEPKDVIALVVLIGLFVLIGLGKLGWENVLPIISAIVFAYIGYRAGEKAAKMKERK